MLSIRGPSVRAESPEVSFDVTPSVGCRDVTAAEFAKANPDEKLVEAHFEVSSLIRQGHEGDLLQYFYRVDSPRPSMKIVAYTPKTTLASDLAGNVTVEKKQETTKGIGLTAAAPLEWPIKLGGSGDLAAKNTDSLRYELLPPMTAVAASGTLDAAAASTSNSNRLAVHRWKAPGRSRWCSACPKAGARTTSI